MRSRLLLALAAAAALVTAVTAAPSSAVATPGIATHSIAAPGIPPAIPGTSSNFELVGLLTELPELSSQFRRRVVTGAVTVPDHDRTR